MLRPPHPEGFFLVSPLATKAQGVHGVHELHGGGSWCARAAGGGIRSRWQPAAGERQRSSILRAAAYRGEARSWRRPCTVFQRTRAPVLVTYTENVVRFARDSQALRWRQPTPRRRRSTSRAPLPGCKAPEDAPTRAGAGGSRRRSSSAPLSGWQSPGPSTRSRLSSASVGRQCLQQFRSARQLPRATTLWWFPRAAKERTVRRRMWRRGSSGPCICTRSRAIRSRT